ncbi:hypothetical protein ACFLQI_01170 [Candidatus Undinarchaeota archaeon]
MGKKKLANSLDSKRKKFADFENAVEDLNDKISEEESELKKVIVELKKANKNVQELRNGIKNLRREMSTHHQAAAKLKKEGKDTDSDFKASVKISKKIKKDKLVIEKLQKEVEKLLKKRHGISEKIEKRRKMRNDLNKDKFELMQDMHQIKLDIREIYTTEKLAMNESMPYEAQSSVKAEKSKASA